MDHEQLISKFHEAVSKKRRDKDIMINTMLASFATSPEIVGECLVYLIQQSFKQKSHVALNDTLAVGKKHNEKYILICKILNSIASSSTLPSQSKSGLIEKIAEYTMQCTRSTNKAIRLRIIVFLITLKQSNILDFDGFSNQFQDCIKRLLIDKMPNIRRAAIKLACLHKMHFYIYGTIENDPSPLNRKSAIGELAENDTENLNVSKCLDDIDQGVRLKTLVYCNKYGILPDKEALTKIFTLMDSDPVKEIREQCKKFLTALTDKIGYKETCDIIQIGGIDRVQENYQQAIINGFSELFSNRLNNTFDLLETSFNRLVREKEKIDLSTLFLTRIMLLVLKSKERNLNEIVEKCGLQETLPQLLKFFFENKEDFLPDYFIKLENIVIICTIDVNELCREKIIENFLMICEKVPLSKYFASQSSQAIDAVLMKDFELQATGLNYFARNEEDVIRCVVEVIREIYKDAEHAYIATLKHGLIDNVTSGAIEEEGNNGPVIPLELKLEKTERKLKRNNEEVFSQIEMKKSRNVVIIDEYDDKREILEKKVKKCQDELSEKYYRGLLITAYVFKHAEFKEDLHPDYLNLIQNFIQLGMKSTNLHILRLSYVCLGFSCLLSKDQASKHCTKFLETFVHPCKILEVTSKMFVYDILLCNRIRDHKLVLDCIRYLQISLNFWNVPEELNDIKNINIEGFCKLLLKKILKSSRPLAIAKLLEIYFHKLTQLNAKAIIKAFIINYSKISEDMCVELANAYLIFIVDQCNSAFKHIDEKIIEISNLLDPELIQNYSQTENIHFLIFVFSCKYFDSNKKFYMKLIQNLNFKTFEDGMRKVTSNCLVDLQVKNPKMEKLEQCIRKIPAFNDIVEDISYREYNLKVEDIASQAELFCKEKKGEFNYS